MCLGIIGFRVQGSGFRVYSVFRDYRVQGLGFRVAFQR